MWLNFSARLKDIDSALKEGADYKAGPLSVMIDISSACYGIGCIGCKDHSVMRPVQTRVTNSFLFFPLDALLRLAADLVSLGVAQIELCGSGEPLVHPDIRSIVSGLHAMGLKLVLRTAGRPLYDFEDPLSFLSFIDQINLSLWAASPETYRMTHPLVPDDFFSFTCNLFREWRGRPRLKIINALCHENYHEIQEMLLLARLLKAAEVSFVNAYEPEWSKNLKLSGTELQRTITELSELQKAENDLIINISGFGGTSGSFPVCIIPFVFARIDIKGRVYPCCGCWNRSIGTLYEGRRFTEIWFSSSAATIRELCRNLPWKGLPGCHCRECVHSEDIQRYCSGL